MTTAPATADALGLAELGQELAAMSDADLTAYVRDAGPEDLDVIEQALALAEAGTVAARFARWWSDPAAFAAEAIAWPEGRALHDYQGDALTTLAQRGRLVLRKPRGVGGSVIAAMSVLWFAVTREYYGADWKVVTTASIGRQLSEYLWPEVHKWAPRLRWDQLGRRRWEDGTELLQQGIKLAHGHAFTAAPGDAATIEGAHASQVLVVLDEAKGIRTAVFDALEGGGTRYGPETGATMYVLATSTPGRPAGRFYDLCRGAEGTENYARQHITVEQGIAAGQVSPSSVEALGKLWGVGSTLYANHVLGEFADDSTDTVIRLSWVEAANERWLALSAAERAAPATEVGVDVAREGADRSVLIAIGQGPAGIVAGRPVELPRGDGPTTAAGVLGHVGLGPVGPLVLVDSEGVGASVYDSLRRHVDLGPRVMAFRAGTGTDWRDVSGELGCANLRSAGWWHLRELLDPSLGATLALPPDARLAGDLTTPKWRDTSRGIVIESKDEIRKRLGRSTDCADALIHAAWGRIMRRGLNLRPAVRRWSEETRGAETDSDGLAGHDWMHEGL